MAFAFSSSLTLLCIVVQVVMLREQKTNEVEAENENLKNLYKEEQERWKAASKMEKLKESNATVSLENDVSALEYEINVSHQECGANLDDILEDQFGSVIK
ncbi:unnamed protein product [Lupinus luteus]|uniref:Uncharacterized protein n=1 Tax=Lupinus luteus TaxID=3873 RepID=A0AAV1XBZ1_LUPLU